MPVCVGPGWNSKMLFFSCEGANSLSLFYHLSLHPELLIEKRSTCVDHIAARPHLPEDTTIMFPDVEPGVFPILASDILSTEPVSSK